MTNNLTDFVMTTGTFILCLKKLFTSKFKSQPLSSTHLSLCRNLSLRRGKDVLIKPNFNRTIET